MNTQETLWSGQLGNEYTIDNLDYTVNLQLFNTKHKYMLQKVYEEMFMDLDRNYRILEIGCNMGHKLELLRRMGFKNLYGLDTNFKTLVSATAKYPEIHFIHSDFSGWITRETFDLVMTNYVMIHVHPLSLNPFRRKLFDLSRKYVFNMEFDKVGPDTEDLEWEGKKDICWKRNMREVYKPLRMDMVRYLVLDRVEDNDFDSAILWNKY